MFPCRAVFHRPNHPHTFVHQAYITNIVLILILTWLLFNLPNKDAVTFFLVVDVLSPVLTSILENEDSRSMHHVVLPVTLIITPVRPSIRTSSLHPVTDEVALKRATILPCEPAMAVFLAIHVLSLVDGTIFPRLFAQTIV